MLKNISVVSYAHSWNIFWLSKRNVRISARPCYILYIIFEKWIRLVYAILNDIKKHQNLLKINQSKTVKENIARNCLKKKTMI